MPLNRENINNTIEEDLTRRNQNWDTLEQTDSDLAAHLADNAEKHFNSHGSGTTGRWVKSDNGIIECWHNLVLPYQQQNRLQGIWTFPQPFIQVSGINISVTPTILNDLGQEDFQRSPDISAIGYIRISALSTTSATIQLYRVEGGSNWQPGDYHRVYIRAIGRWK